MPMMVEVLSQIGWSIVQPPMVIDHEGLCHNFVAMPGALLYRLLVHGWLQHVARCHTHRKQMADLQGLDPALLQADAKQLTALDARGMQRSGLGPSFSGTNIPTTTLHRPAVVTAVVSQTQWSIAYGTAQSSHIFVSHISGQWIVGTPCLKHSRIICCHRLTRTCLHSGAACTSLRTQRGFSSVRGLVWVGSTCLLMAHVGDICTTTLP